jgi:uncharacterized membrane protein
MDNMVYLVAAYAVFWLLTFALVIGMWLRQRRLTREIKLMERRLPVLNNRERRRRGK